MELATIHERRDEKGGVLGEDLALDEKLNPTTLGTNQFHQSSIEDCVAILKTRLNLDSPSQSGGLTNEVGAKRLAQFGPNALTPPPTKHPVLKYLEIYLDPLHMLLIVAGVLSMIAYGIDKSVSLNLYLGCTLFAVAVFSSTFTFLQEGEASEVMETFKKMLVQECQCVRDGKLVKMNAAELVPGDVLMFKAGDKIPADVRFFYTAEIKVEMSSLTGESVPVPMEVKQSDKNVKFEETRCCAFNSCGVVEGEGAAVVIATGDNTLIGRIARLASGTHIEDTPLQVELKKFVKLVLVIAIITGLILFVVGMARGQSFLHAFVNCFVLVIIAWVPQGLPTTVTSCLSITAKRMSAKNVFIKELKSVETLGSTTCIASDKTGTLTQNKMTVVHLWFDQSAETETTVVTDSWRFKKGSTLHALEMVAGVVNNCKFEDELQIDEKAAHVRTVAAFLHQSDPTLTINSARRNPVMSGLDHIGVTNEMTIRSVRKQVFSQLPIDSDRSAIFSDASETAIFNYVIKRHSIELIRYHYPILFEIPFNSRYKYALRIVKQMRTGDNRRILMIKGAPEVILARCSNYMFHGSAKPIDDSFRRQVHNAIEGFANNGERVLGFAHLYLDEKDFGADKDSNFYSLARKNFPQDGYTLLGLMGLQDPPKPGVKEAVFDVRKAGVKVIMVTGDHALTAAAIARQVGIITGPTEQDIKRMEERQKQEESEEEKAHPNTSNRDFAITPNDVAISVEQTQAIVINGPEIDKFDEKRWDEVLSKQEIVFARTTPVQKLLIVQNLQRHKHVVAVTGDGVNDSPALKKANIGIAMGSGAEVAKGTADVILMDDSFTSIVLGIREGRVIFDNLRKTIAYTWTHMFPEIVPIIFNLAFSLPLALSPLCLLSIDCAIELGPAISLSYEKAESNVMLRPPRDNENDRLVSRNLLIYSLVAGLVESFVGFVGFFAVFAYKGIGMNDLANSADNYFKSDADPFTTKSGLVFKASEQTAVLDQASTAYFALLVMSQFFHIFFVKTRSIPLHEHGLFENPTMIYGVFIQVTVLCLIVFVPGLQSFFSTDAFYGPYWALLLVGGVMLYLINEPRKIYATKYPESWVAKYLTW